MLDIFIVLKNAMQTTGREKKISNTWYEPYELQQWLVWQYMSRGELVAQTSQE